MRRKEAAKTWVYICGFDIGRVSIKATSVIRSEIINGSRELSYVEVVLMIRARFK